MMRIFYSWLIGPLLSCEVVYGAGHGGAALYDARRLAVVKKFLRGNF